MKPIAYALLVAVIAVAAASAHDEKATDGSMRGKMELSVEQKDKVKAAKEARAAAAKPLREQGKQSREKLREQLKNKASDGDIQATLDELERNRESLRGVNQKFMAEMKSFLTPTQRARMMLKKMRGKHDHEEMD